MKSTLLSLSVIILFTGCVSVDSGSYYATDNPTARTMPVNEMHKIRLGMSRQEVEALLKDELLIGYTIEGSPEKLNPITMVQPHREESFSRDQKTYHVLYYYTSVNRPDDLVAEDELTPLIFEGNALIGKGLADLDRIKRM